MTRGNSPLCFCWTMIQHETGSNDLHQKNKAQRCVEEEKTVLQSMGEFQYETTWCQALETEVWAKHQRPQMHHRWFEMAKGNFKYKITDRGSDETSPSKERVQQIWLKSLLFIQCFFSKICLNSRNQDHRSPFPPRSKINIKIKHFVMLHITFES